MQNEQNTRQDETTLTEAEVSFARNLEKSLSLAMGEDDKVTSIWSRLKPEQRRVLPKNIWQNLPQRTQLIRTT